MRSSGPLTIGQVVCGCGTNIGEPITLTMGASKGRHDVIHLQMFPEVGLSDRLRQAMIAHREDTGCASAEVTVTKADP